MTRNEPFFFDDDVERISPPGAHIAQLPANIGSKEELLRSLYGALKFPGYFGFNWDALSDCLRDFHWLKSHTVVLAHADFPRLAPSERRIYLDVLAEAIAGWQSAEDHEFRVVFPTACYNEVTATLKASSSR